MSVAVLSGHTLEQRLDALGRANGIRISRAAAKRRWKTMPRIKVCRELASLLDDPGEVWLSMKVYDLLRAVPSFGQTKATSMMAQCGISLHKRVGGLTPRQRNELSNVLLMVPERRH